MFSAKSLSALVLLLASQAPRVWGEEAESHGGPLRPLKTTHVTNVIVENHTGQRIFADSITILHKYSDVYSNTVKFPVCVCAPQLSNNDSMTSRDTVHGTPALAPLASTGGRSSGESPYHVSHMLATYTHTEYIYIHVLYMYSICTLYVLMRLPC